MLTSILQLDDMETRLDEAKLTEDRLCAEMSSLGLVHSLSMADS